MLGDSALGLETAGAPAAGPAARSGGREIKSCRWRATPDQGDFCTHRDVLPFAGKEGFKPESWCPECAFYKLRRTPKKRERIDYGLSKSGSRFMNWFMGS